MTESQPSFSLAASSTANTCSLRRLASTTAGMETYSVRWASAELSLLHVLEKELEAW